MTLISDSQMAALRKTAELGMIATVAIYYHTVLETEDGSESAWVLGGTTKGWLYNKPDANTQVVAGGQGHIEVYRLYLPVGTELDYNDRVVIGGHTYTVIDSTGESTWLPLLEATIKRIVR